MLTKSSASLLFIGSIAISYQLQLPTVLYSLLIVLSLYYLVTDIVYDQIKDYLLPSASKDYKENLQRLDHDERRSNTYPELIPNTWYHLCDSDEIKVNEVKEIRMLKQVFAVWRDSKGGIVCQEAFCLHLGANLAVGGKIVDDCIECPFHRWKFSNDGTIVNIPYINNPTHCPTNKKLKTFHCVEWNGLICVYYHADDEPPAFSMPEFITNELRDGNWKPHLKWDLGFTTLSVIDWVDQAGDHAHFHTLHADMLIPWTTFPIPQLILDWFPISIKHNVTTYRGDDKEWSEKNASTGQNRIDKHLMFFTDYVGITWAGKPMMSTFSETLEMFCGPAIMVFHIPFTIGKILQ